MWQPAYHGDGVVLSFAGDLLLHGHTHIYKAQKEGDVHVANPGSITLPKDGLPASYGVLDGRELWIRDMSGRELMHLEF
ncbi:MAG: metallophosphoesterase family protein [Clostridia bacterium]